MESWFEVEFLLLKILNLQPSELDSLQFYRAEILMENLKKWNEKERENNKSQESQSQTGFNNSQYTDALRKTQSQFKMPKMPGMPNF